MENLTLFRNNKEKKVFFLILFLFFLINISIEYSHYNKFTSNEIYQTNGTVVNIYPKKIYTVLKVQTNNFTFFTTTAKNSKIKPFQNINVFLVTKDIDFISYLKGFYINSFNISTRDTNTTNKEFLYRFIRSQHSSKSITSLYSALYLATPLDIQIRELSSKLGISHLIAISGFHLGVISLVLYFILHLLYYKIHKSFFPYRNKRFDIMLVISVFLFTYLVFLDIPASLLRAFIMFVFALFLLRNNIKIISFETLFIIVVFIIALFPKLLFSLSLWFSVSGVFYIFLFIKYFKNLNKYIQFFLFNFWIYLAMNPITHYFFGTLSKEQLYSPILTILFTLFYPISIILHSFNIGGVLDKMLQNMIDLNIVSIETFTPLWMLLLYLLVSVLAIIKNYMFILLNILLILYNIWLFLFLF
jgi:competence protein ComEC